MVYWLIFWTLSVISGQKVGCVHPQAEREDRPLTLVGLLEITVSFLVIFLVSFLLCSCLPQASSSLHVTATCCESAVLSSSLLLFRHSLCFTFLHMLTLYFSNFNCLKNWFPQLSHSAMQLYCMMSPCLWNFPWSLAVSKGYLHHLIYYLHYLPLLTAYQSVLFQCYCSCLTAPYHSILLSSTFPHVR
jgi:hypothetical protein